MNQSKVTDYLDFTTIDTPRERRIELGVGDIFINQGECLDCGWIIRSKNRHNMAHCKCGKTAIDGGSWYVRTMGNIKLHTVMYKDIREEEDE